MREIDFSENNLFCRWLGVKSIWSDLERETRHYVKRRLERAMVAEVTSRVGCARYQRSYARQGYRNGSYARDLLTSYGWIEGLEVPRVREGGFVSDVFEKYHRRQRMVDIVLLEAFLLGHSTRKTRRLFRRLFGSTISAQAVSNIVHELDDDVQSFHQRVLGDDYQTVYLDGLWVTLSRPVKVKKVLLIALGVRVDGSKELLGFHLAPSESEACWWGFLSDLKHRGLLGMSTIVSDGAAGLVKSIRGLYPRVGHQLCTFHKAMDLAAHLMEKRHRRRIIADALHIFDADNQTQARQRLRRFAQKWQDREPKAVRCFLREVDACFVFFQYPPPLWRSLKTSNPIERYIEEIRRRIIPMRSFNNERSVERIVYGIIAYVIKNNQGMSPNPIYT